MNERFRGSIDAHPGRRPRTRLRFHRRTTLVLTVLLAACGSSTEPEPPDDPPAAPTLLSVQNAETVSITLTWAANAEEDLSHYNVHQGTESGALTQVAEVSAGTEVYEATGLESGTTYYFAVDAEDEGGNRSEASAEVSAQTTLLRYLVRGQSLSSHGGNVYIYLDNNPVEDAAVTLNGESFIHLGGAAYRRYPLDEPVDAGGTHELVVTIGEIVITATGLVPEQPTVTGPADGADFAPDATIPVAWTSDTDPDRFSVMGSYITDSGGGTSRGDDDIPGTDREWELDAGLFPTDGRDVQIGIGAFNDGTFEGPVEPGSTMGIRALSSNALAPVVTVTE